MPRNVLKVGITGGIGSGKSFICNVFENLGIDVYYADTRAKWLQQNDAVLIKKISGLFGEQAYDQQGTLNRTFIANIVFSDASKLAALNKLVHPSVAQDYHQWVKQRSDQLYTIKEAALLFETDAHQSLDKIINVNAPNKIRIQRVVQRDRHRSPQQVEGIIRQQLSDEERSARADYNINNSGTKLVIPQVLRVHQTLINQ